MYRLIIQADSKPLRAEVQAGGPVGPGILGGGGWTAHESYTTNPITAASELAERVAALAARNPEMSAVAAQQRALELWLAELKADALDDDGLPSDEPATDPVTEAIRL